MANLYRSETVGSLSPTTVMRKVDQMFFFYNTNGIVAFYDLHAGQQISLSVSSSDKRTTKGLDTRCRYSDRALLSQYSRAVNKGSGLTCLPVWLISGKAGIQLAPKTKNYLI